VPEYDELNDDTGSQESAEAASAAVLSEAPATSVATLDADDDPVAALRQALRFAPGDWYVVHSYAGYENKVKTNLETRITSLDMEDFIYQVEVPTREEVEVKNGKRMQVQNKVFPGYILVRMELTAESYSCVRNTPGVTGFVGATDRADPRRRCRSTRSSSGSRRPRRPTPRRPRPRSRSSTSRSATR